MGKIRSIIKRPDEKYGHVTRISNTLRNLQNTVDGPIEVVSISDSVVMIVNEEGKLRGLEKNFIMGNIVKDIIVGDVMVCGTKDGEFIDLPEWFDFQMWKKLLEYWGN